MCLVLLFLSAQYPLKTSAALSSSDLLSDSRPSQLANHETSWTVADAGGIAEGESFNLTFSPEFDTSSIDESSVDLFDDAVSMTLAANCSGGEKVSFNNLGSNIFQLQICAGDGGAIAFGSIVTVKIGTNAAGGTDQISNPLVAGSYYLLISGNGGYSDNDRIGLSIISGVGTTAQIVAYGSLRIIGYASPGATVYFLEGGSVIGTQIANSSSSFDKTLTGLTPGIHFISIYAADTGSRNTLTISFGINIVAGMTIVVSGIILPPTISLSSNQVKRPAQLTAQGKAKDNASVQVYMFGSGDNKTENVPTNASGDWSANVNPKLHLGNKGSNSQSLDGFGGISEFSQTRNYEVKLSTDLNVDNLVNLTDFSILMYNYGTSSPPNVLADINDNGPVDLVDFSVMMYYWTGG